MKNKIKIKEIRFIDGESDRVPLIPTTVYSWNKANAFLMKRSCYKESKIGDLKTDFVITFEDGFEYKGTYELKHLNFEKGDLKGHILRNALFYSGRHRPSHIETDESYNLCLTEEGKELYSQLLDHYDIGYGVSINRDIVCEKEILNQITEIDIGIEIKKLFSRMENKKVIEHGNIVFTRGVQNNCLSDKEFFKFVLKSLEKHLLGDWGEMCLEDIRENDYSLENNFRVFSSYEHDSHSKIYIVTERDRSLTTVLFPSEY